MFWAKVVPSQSTVERGKTVFLFIKCCFFSEEEEDEEKKSAELKVH